LLPVSGPNSKVWGVATTGAVFAATGAIWVEVGKGRMGSFKVIRIPPAHPQQAGRPRRTQRGPQAWPG